MLSLAQMVSRDGKLTASRVACLMTDDQEKILNLWRELTGQPFTEDDLSGVWAVQLGTATEALNLDWFARKHGPVSMRGRVVELEPWAAATLDGWSDQHQCPIECKHVGGREPMETIIERYQPQMHWQMIVTDTDRCALSVIMGANEPIVEYIDIDEEYAKELWVRANAFMACVQTRTPPVAIAPVAPPVKAEKIYNFHGRNEWASEAAAWLANKDAAKLAVSAEKAIKALVPADAAKCVGHGIQVSRNRAGSLSVREDQEAILKRTGAV
jgi:YqaJ-like viral recombinase domain